MPLPSVKTQVSMDPKILPLAVGPGSMPFFGCWNGLKLTDLT